jgi:hypothetical protein
MKTALLAMLFCAVPYTAAIAQGCSKHSPTHTVALLELYTSEGCSSCPPADRKLSTLRGSTPGSDTGLDRLVPLSLHVDYWNDIGWKDGFSSGTYTERQRALSALANSRIVYTPEVFVAGRELRNWSNEIPATVRRINSQPARADIVVTLGEVSGGSIPVDVRAHAGQGGKLYVALYENNLVSEVTSGENRGATLHHDFLVRQWVGPIALSAQDAGGKAGLTRSLPVPAGVVAGNLGVAAFVQGDRGDILQAVALGACGA